MIFLSASIKLITEAFKSDSVLKSESFLISLGGSAWQSERFVISRSRVQIPPGALFNHKPSLELISRQIGYGIVEAKDIRCIAINLCLSAVLFFNIFRLF